MPFELDPVFPTPLDSTKLWRYMDVGRFLVLLQKPSFLYFARKHELKDAWEGTRPQLFTRLIGKSLTPEDAVEVKKFIDSKTEQAVISCWHANDRESVAMWNLYTSGDEGVAIQTTVRRLKNVLRNEPCRVRIVRVKYDDHDTAQVGSDELHIMTPLVLKRKCFEHEREVRVVILSPFQRQLVKVGSGPLPELFSCERQDRSGLHVEVNPKEFIERIVVSPRYPQWAVPALQEIVSLAGISIRIELSETLRRPE